MSVSRVACYGCGRLGIAAMVLILGGLLGLAVRPAAAQGNGGAKSAAPGDAGAAKADQNAGEEAPEKTPPTKPAAAGKAAPKPAVAAPQYIQEPVDESLKRQRTLLAKILRAQAFQPGEEAAFDAYYTKYAFPRWTVPENYWLIAANQADGFRKQLQVELTTGRQGAPYDKLVEHTLAFAKKVIANKDYHWTVRVNAMYAAGDLNLEEPPPGPNAAVRPHPEGLRLIVQVLNDPEQIDAVRVAALVCLVRHCAVGIPNQARNQVEKLLLDYASAKTPAEGRSAAGHAWMRARAIESLGELNGPKSSAAGVNGAVVKALLGIATETGTPLQPTRLTAVRALGVLNYKSLADPKPVDVAKVLGQLVLEACIAELERKDEVVAGTPTMGGGMYGGMMPGMGGMMPAGSGMRPPGSSGMRSAGSSGMRMSGSSGMMPAGSGSRPGSSGMRSSGSSGMMPAGSGGRPSGGGRSSGGSKGRAGSSMMGSSMMGPGMMGPGMMGPGMGLPDEDVADERSLLFRRRLKMVLGAVQSALAGERASGSSGVSGWAKGTPDEKAIDLLGKHVAGQIKDLDEEEKGLPTLRKAITGRKSDMKKWVADPHQAASDAEAEAAKKKGKHS